jgi:tRNA (guanine37-N1)-methyltransferase
MADANAQVTFELVSLFPELFDGFLRTSLLGRAIAAGIIAVERTNPRDFAQGRHRSVDDTPCGGGPGMVLAVPPLVAALDEIEKQRGSAHRILLSPRGRLFDQAKAHHLAATRRIVLVCGRYEGIDERVGAVCDEELSIGDYVLAGGELAAAVIIEAVARLVPGVLGSGLSAADESFSYGRLEYPQWTRPFDFRGQTVPAILLSGDHGVIERWRRREALRRTQEFRPDLVARYPLTDEERAWMKDDGDPARASDASSDGRADGDDGAGAGGLQDPSKGGSKGHH